MNSQLTAPVSSRRRARCAPLAVTLTVIMAALAGCSGGENDADALPEYTGAATTSAAPTETREQAAKAVALEYYDTLRDLFMSASADRDRLSRLASGNALEDPLEELKDYQKNGMPDNGKRTVKVLQVTPQGENVIVRTCYDKRKVRFLEPDGEWGTTLAINIDEEGLTLAPTAGGWKVTAVKNIFSGGCHK